MHQVNQATHLSKQTHLSFLWRPFGIYFLACVISFFLSNAAMFRSIVNPDAICYLESAAAIPSGLHQAMQVCGQAKWPFFSVLIYYFSHFTHLSYLYSAYLIDSLFSMLSIISFIAIVRHFNTSIRVTIFAALTILLAKEFNSIREYIIRDHGFWAFYLVSIFCLLRYVQRQSFYRAIAWGLSSILATLFRIEGSLFLIFIPFISFLMPLSFREKVKSFFQLSTISLVLTTCLLLFIVFHQNQDTLSHLTRVNEVLFQLRHGLSDLTNKFNEHAYTFSKTVLSKYAGHEAKTIFVLLLLTWFVFAVVTNLTLIFSLLVGYAWCKKALKTTKMNHLILWSYVILNIVITSLFLIQNMFLSKRYLLALSLTLMIWIPFALEQLFLEWPKRRNVLVGVVACMLIFSLDGIVDFGHSKKYIRDAGNWISINVPKNASLYSNDKQVMYYSEHYGSDLYEQKKMFSTIKITADNNWNQYDYIAIRTHKKIFEKDKLNLASLGPPIKVFSNKRGDGVYIYKIH